jgi:hypothetical protein
MVRLNAWMLSQKYDIVKKIFFGGSLPKIIQILKLGRERRL